MRLGDVLMGAMVLVSLGLAAFIHQRKKDDVVLFKQINFQHVKFKVSLDVLADYKDEADKVQRNLEQLRTVVKEKNIKIVSDQVGVDKLKKELEECAGIAKHNGDGVAVLETEQKSVSSGFLVKKEDWTNEITSLKTEITQRSKLCDFILKTSNEARILCKEDPLPAQPELTKQEEPKAAGQLAEEPKAAEPQAPRKE
uniref:Uncharacterized protein n=1 Tax=Denticeps clupeoides TaxID=299321 RepID=A0AAY4ADR2_9TELE